MFVIPAIGQKQLPPPILEQECLATLPVAGEITKANPLPQFSVSLTDPAGQRLQTEEQEVSRQTVPALRLQTAEPQPLELRSLSLPATPGMRFSAGVMVKPVSVTAGYLELLLIQIMPDGTEIPLERRLLTDLKSDRWTSRSITMPKDKGGLDQPGAVCIVVRGEFAGELLLRQFSLILREQHPR
jgi:hypothetical protein